jgi:hypothetical protein
MTKSITVINTMAKNTLANRHIVWIMDYVRTSPPIGVSSQTDLLAGAMPAEAIPAGQAPFLVHGEIKSCPSAAKCEA